MFGKEHIEKVLSSHKYEIVGNNDLLLFKQAKSIDEASTNDITWISQKNTNLIDTINQCNASVIVVSNDITISPSHCCLIKCDNPKLIFSLIVNDLLIEKPKAGIHSTAQVEPHADIHPSAYIGPFCVIGKCKIGANSILRGHNFLYDNVEIGKNVEIHANTVLGAIGSGYSADEDDTLVPFPHLGKAIIEDNVEVGPNTYINRGALKNTIIKKGAKIGNSVCIGHNVEIGENSIILANSVIAGSTKIGKNSWVSPNASVKNGTTHGDQVTIGLGAVVTKNTNDNQTVIGNPAQDIESFKKYLKFIKENSFK